MRLGAVVLTGFGLAMADDNTNSSNKSTSSTTSSSSTSISINPAGSPGALTFISPVTTKSLYVKVGDYQTFSWNYTGVLVTPTAVNIDLYCSQNSHTVMLASNHSYDDTQFIWNTTDTNENDPDDMHLITAKYTLRIYNSSGSASDTPYSGYLAPATYVFGVYLPQSYNSWANAGKYVNAANAPAAGALAAILLFTGLVLFM